MKKVFIIILTISLSISCNNSKNKTVYKNYQNGLIPENSNILIKELKKKKELNQITCIFSNPDTSVAGIKIGNIESTFKILGKETKLEGDSTHFFYSSDKMQKLGLTVHSGSYYSQVSIFNISYSGNSRKDFQQINLKEFETEKGIKLGISKREITERLGSCYAVKDSTINSIELYYKLEFPNDSGTKLLKNNNMPIYYATYRLINDKLDKVEFGFEYP